MANNLQHHFARFFRWNLLSTMVLVYLALGGIAIGALYSQVNAAQMAAESYLHSNRTYFLGLALANNLQGVRIAIDRQTAKNNLVTYTLELSGKGKASVPGLELSIAGRNYGKIVYAINYPAIFLDYRVILAATALLTFAGSILLFFRRVSRFILNNLVTPIENLSREISSKSDLTGLSSVKTPEDTIDEVKQIHRSLIDTARIIRNSQNKLKQIEVWEALGHAAQGVAHDIRSPLAALSAATRSIRGLSKEERDIIVAATDRIRSIANGLLDYAKRAQEEKGALRDVCGYLCQLMNEKKLEWKGRSQTILEFRPSNSLLLMDGTRLTSLGRAVSNLLNNSIEASGDGPTPVVMSVCSQGDALEVCIEDKGRGIPADVIARLGTAPFSEGKSGESGNGLGIFHARKFLDSIQGDLLIESARGQGTRVTMRIPNGNSNLR